ncbi:MAG: hypothetical protein FWE48_04420 [Coriobacteriia bacterium]|nr:hypothetical protein [Coriobacteriia bacterium]MCL2870383.1 hypothetical protein [Coriobacteriia bacterium]
MPVSERGFEYEMPKEIEELITKDFCKEFYRQLEATFSTQDLSTFNSLAWDSIECSVGWAKAFDTVSDKLCPELKSYVHSLEWYDSDMFAGKVTSVLCDYGLIELNE